MDPGSRGRNLGTKDGPDIFFTRTMAEILEKQGFLEDALVIYNILAETNPGDSSIKVRIEELKGLAARGRKKKGFKE